MVTFLPSSSLFGIEKLKRRKGKLNMSLCVCWGHKEEKWSFSKITSKQRSNDTQRLSKIIRWILKGRVSLCSSQHLLSLAVQEHSSSWELRVVQRRLKH